MRRLFLISIVVGILVSCISFAEEPNDPIPLEPAFQYANTIRCSISKSGGNVACKGLASSRDSSTITSITVTLQRKPSVSNGWYTICTWSASATGTSEAIVNESNSTSNGYDYRVKMYWKIQDSSSNTLESGTIYSSTVSY